MLMIARAMSARLRSRTPAMVPEAMTCSMAVVSVNDWTWKPAASSSVAAVVVFSEAEAAIFLKVDILKS